MRYFNVFSSKMALILKFRASVIEGFVTLLFIKVEGQNLAKLEYFDVYFFKKLSIFKIQGFYDVL